MEFAQEYYEAHFKPKGGDTIVCGYMGETAAIAVRRAREQAALRAEDDGGDPTDPVDGIAVYHCTRVEY